jgi:hypothetical protein|tara:strand:- start:19048 stop:19203 length:156 start_codon:yes stop_codon:yes gene_type:complete
MRDIVGISSIILAALLPATLVRLVLARLAILSLLARLATPADKAGAIAYRS